MADVQIVAGGVSGAPLDYVVPGAQEIVLKTLYAEFDGTAATGAWLPVVEIIAPGGKRSGQYRTQDTVPAGDSAHVTWGPFLGPKGTTLSFPRNVGELGFTGSGTQDSTYTHTIAFENVQVGDGILVSAQAPSRASAAPVTGTAISCADSAGNTYTFLDEGIWEAAAVAVNQGAHQVLFFCTGSIAPLVAGVDTITVTWDESVFDRSIYAWLIRHDGGPNYPTTIAATPNNSAAVFASNQVTLTSPAWTPARDNALAFATIMAIKAGGVGGFGAVAGFTGYFQSQFRSFTGSKQVYLFNVQTFGADVYLVVGAAHPQYEIDLGTLPGGIPIGAFNGVGQFYSAGANAWKGILLFSLD